MKHLTLNRVFAAYLAYFALVVTGFLPRESVPFAALALVAWISSVPLGQATLFFIRAIPLFIAIPLTETYDNLTLWRPIALILFARLLIEKETRDELLLQWGSIRHGANNWLRSHPVFRRLSILLVLAALSLIGATYPLQGIVRIVYFVNLSMVPVIIYALIRRGTLSSEEVIRAIATSTIIVISVGFLQLASTYLMDIYGFMRFWGEEVQLRQFGEEWSNIAVTVGNTWLAYYGEQLSLRVFSLFPDSHSFPTFVLLGIPALFAIALDPILRLAKDLPVRTLVRNYSKLAIVWVPLGYLAAILSGTRGIWASFIGVVILVPCVMWIIRKLGADQLHRRMFSYTASYLTLFVLLFGIAWPIFISPQFLIGKADLGMFGRRIRSVIDFGETSNALRIAIWKASVSSITDHPFLGVGIANFPVVLNEKIELSRAGSSAHNLYLHVAAEMGIFAALEMIVLLFAAWWSTIRVFLKAQGKILVYAGALLLHLPWVLAYVMTDPIIFDERVFLLFGTTLALVWANIRHD